LEVCLGLPKEPEARKTADMEISPTKVKRPPTNPTGPMAWNDEVLAVFKDMGAHLGVIYEECKDHKEFLASCKELGLVRAGAMQEASRRRGGPPKKSPAKKELLATIPEEASVLSTPPKRKSSKKVQAEQEAPGAPEKPKNLPEIERLPSDTAKDIRLLAEWHAEVTDADMRYQIIKGVRYLVSAISREVIELEHIGQMGPTIGRLNEETGEIEAL
jgi:hypothetical protein